MAPVNIFGHVRRSIMIIHKTLEETRLCIAPVGRLDTTTASEFENELGASLDNVKELILDLTKLSYVSSAGLRVILKAQKRMNTQGSMKVRGANENIMEVFEITGFADVLTFE